MANGFDSSGSSNGAPAVQSAMVVDNKDPNQMGRVKVSFPWDGNSSQSNWAKVVQPLAGSAYGQYILPEVGDEVLVAFLNNNHDTPIVIGGLYNSDNKQSDTYDADNYIKNIKTKAGNEIRFLDKGGSEQITITNKTSSDNQIILTMEDNGKITIQSKGKIELTAPEINMNANKKFTISGGDVSISGEKITLDARKDIETSAKGKVSTSAVSNIELSATSDLKLSGMNITGSAEVGVQIKGNATAELSASGQTVVKGAVVMIN